MKDEVKRVANNALIFLSRVSLQGKEVGEYIQVNQLLGRLANGELVAVSPAELPVEEFPDSQPRA